MQIGEPVQLAVAGALNFSILTEFQQLQNITALACSILLLHIIVKLDFEGSRASNGMACGAKVGGNDGDCLVTHDQAPTL